MIKVKRFNKTGNEEFENKIEELCTTGKKNKLESSKVQKLLKQIIELSKSASKIETVEQADEIEQKSFKDRHELGVYLFNKLSKCDFAKIHNDVNLWNWLTAFYIKNVFSGRATEIVRFIYKKRFFQGKRHLIRTPWILVVTNSTQVESLKFCLSTPTHQGSNMCEQFISRMDLWKNPSVVQLCYDLYYDPVAGKQRKGADNHRKIKDDDGTEYNQKGVLYPRLYKDILILSKNKDVWDLSPSEINSEIRDEFDIWKDIDARSGNKDNKSEKKKNPPWTRNELSICLWFYHKEDKEEILSEVGEVHSAISSAIKLLKNEHGENFDPNDNFRNPTGVWRKLRNFAALDKSISNEKFQDDHFSNLDQEVFRRYEDKKNFNDLSTVVKVISKKNNLNLIN